MSFTLEYPFKKEKSIQVFKSQFKNNQSYILKDPKSFIYVNNLWLWFLGKLEFSLYFWGNVFSFV